MTPLEGCSQKDKDLACAHLHAKTERGTSTTTEVVQNLWWETSLHIRTFFQKDPTFAYNHIYGVIVYEESDNEELVEPAAIPSNDVKQSPSLRTIPKAWKEYSEKWFYSYPFGDESSS